MAADTAQRRFSAMTMMLPFRGPRVVPSGTIGAEQRQAMLLLYSGIAFGGGAPPANSILIQMLQHNQFAGGARW